MQIHIVGPPSPLSLRLLHILNYLGVNCVSEPQFSGGVGSTIILAGPATLPPAEPQIPVILLGGENLPQLTLHLRGQGQEAIALLEPPFGAANLEAALHSARLQHAVASSQTEMTPATLAKVAEICGDHPVLDNLRASAAAAGEQDSPTLILGETGTGKRRIASIIHRCSARADGPFVPVSCATFPESLLAAELFGCERGALPGALVRRVGRLEMAEGGTLLLEDIEALSIQSQASLLAYLRTNRLERIGSVRGIASDIRLLTSSSIDLRLLVERGEFREDLYYAIQKLVVRVPPLRDYIVSIRQNPANFELDFEPGVLDESVWERLCAYPWPGNLVELAACAQQLATRDHGVPISRDDLPESLRDSCAQATPSPSAAARLRTTNDTPLLPVNGLDLKEYLADLEKNLITQALQDTGSVVARAADRLHVRRTTLVEKMRKYGLQRG